MATPRKRKKSKAKKRVKKAKSKSPKAKPRKKSKSRKKPVKRSKTRRSGVKAKPRKTTRKKKSKSRGGVRIRTPKRAISGVPTPPPGFESVFGVTLEQAISVIQSRLGLAGDLGRVRVWPYADGTADGEILAKLPRGQSASDVLLAIEDLVGREGLEGYWVSVGVRYTIKEDDEIYRRFKGYNDVNTHYQRATATNVAEVFVIGRHEIAEGMANKYGRKADSVYLRIHWNPDNVKPPQRETH